MTPTAAKAIIAKSGTLAAKLRNSSLEDVKAFIADHKARLEVLAVEVEKHPDVATGGSYDADGRFHAGCKNYSKLAKDLATEKSIEEKLLEAANAARLLKQNNIQF